MKDIEIILVDDGSPDMCGRICDEYAAKDKRIRVIHKENGGLSAARNSGYHIAQGEWITFLDGDDWIESDTCKEMYSLGMQHNVEIVIFGTIQEFNHYKNTFQYHYKNGRIFRGSECKELQCEVLNFSGNIATAWAKLIRKSVLDNYNIEHNETLRQGAEGIEFNIRLFERISSAYFTDKICYHYIYNPNSISAKHDEKNHYYVIKCFEKINEFIDSSKNKSILKAKLYNRLLFVIVTTAISGYFSSSNNEPFREKKRKFIQYLNQPLITEALKGRNYSDVGIKRAIVLFLIRNNLFVTLNLFAKIRNKQKNR